MRHSHPLCSLALASALFAMGGATALSQRPAPFPADPNVLVGCPYHGMGYGGPHGMMGCGIDGIQHCASGKADHTSSDP